MSLEILAGGLLVASLVCFLVAALMAWLLAIDSLTRAYRAVNQAQYDTTRLMQLAYSTRDYKLFLEARAALTVSRRIARAIVKGE